MRFRVFAAALALVLSLVLFGFAPAASNKIHVYSNLGELDLYIPPAQVSYFSVDEAGRPINISNAAITCLVLDSQGETYASVSFATFGNQSTYVRSGTGYTRQNINITGYDPERTTVTIAGVDPPRSDVQFFVYVALLLSIAFFAIRSRR